EVPYALGGGTAGESASLELSSGRRRFPYERTGGGAVWCESRTSRRSRADVSTARHTSRLAFPQRPPCSGARALTTSPYNSLTTASRPVSSVERGTSRRSSSP